MKILNFKGRWGKSAIGIHESKAELSHDTLQPPPQSDTIVILQVAWVGACVRGIQPRRRLLKLATVKFEDYDGLTFIWN